MPIEFKGSYAQLPDAELLALVKQSDDLNPDSYEALWAEIRKRGLERDAARAYEEHRLQLESTTPAAKELVIIARFHHAAEADMAKTKLESAGISSFLADEVVLRFGLPKPPARQIKLEVRREDIEQAVALLKDIQATSESA